MTSVPRLLRRLVAGFFLLGLVGLAAAAEKPRTFDLPGGPAEETLKLFAKQAGREIVFAGAAVAQVKTNPVTGELPPREALSALLANTGLVATEDNKSGAFAVRREAPVEKNAPARLQEKPATEGKKSGKQVENGVVKLEDFRVTGSRLPINSGEQPSQPVLSYTARDIERSGATTLGQFWQYIPALSTASTGDQSRSATGDFSGGQASSTANRTFATIRGGTGFTSTLMLVDGKRVPRTNQQQAGSLGQDLGGIPLSAIERIDVLLDGASAIYGADAMGGVINVILKKRYSGTEVRLTYDNTFDKDAGQWTASLSHGFSSGKWSGLMTVANTENNIMLMVDREQTRSFDRTLYGGTSTGAFGIYRIGQTGSVNVASGTLPGLTSNYAAIPANANGQNLTIASFAASGLPTIDASPRDMGATTYIKQRSGFFRLAYDLNEHLQIEGTTRLSHNFQQDNGVYRRALNLTLPATFPGNPFGVPIRLQKLFYDLPRLVKSADSRNNEFALTASGKLFADWRYETGVNFARTIAKDNPARLGNGAYGTANLQVAALNAAIAAGRAPVLIYDSSTQSPNAATSLDEFFVNSLPIALGDDSQIWTYSTQANGTVYEWAGGPIRLAVGAESREEYYDSPDSLNADILRGANRSMSAYYAEIGVPLVRSEWKLPLMHRLDFNYAMRHESTPFGDANTPRYGLAWRPQPWIMLRASQGEGFRAPNISQTNRPPVSFQIPASAADQPIDPLRGNENFLGRILTYTGGGNPNLKPERSKTETYGVVVDVPKVTGLQLSFDYFDNETYDLVGSVSGFPTLLAYAPQAIIRGPNLPGDQPGWPGPITGVNLSGTNLSLFRSVGYDFGVKWTRSTPWGDFTLTSNGNKILSTQARLFADAAPVPAVHKKFQQMRVTNSVRWARGPWETGLTHLYGGRVWVSSGNEAMAASRYTDPVHRWDVNAGYDFSRSARSADANAAWWQRLLRNSRVSVSVLDVLNEEPPLDVNGFASNSIIDPRLRRYILDVTTRF